MTKQEFETSDFMDAMKAEHEAQGGKHGDGMISPEEIAAKIDQPVEEIKLLCEFGTKHCYFMWEIFGGRYAYNPEGIGA